MITPEVGRQIFFDCRPYALRTIGRCDWWEAAEFSLDCTGGGPIKQVAVNITVTGRKIQRHDKVRVLVEFVGDCEPSTFERGWMYVA